MTTEIQEQTRVNPFSSPFLYYLPFSGQYQVEINGVPTAQEIRAWASEQEAWHRRCADGMPSRGPRQRARRDDVLARADRYARVIENADAIAADLATKAQDGPAPSRITF